MEASLNDDDSGSLKVNIDELAAQNLTKEEFYPVAIKPYTEPGQTERKEFLQVGIEVR